MKEALPSNFYTNLDDFSSKIVNENKFRPHGHIINSYTRDVKDCSSPKIFEIYKVFIFFLITILYYCKHSLVFYFLLLTDYLFWSLQVSCLHHDKFFETVFKCPSHSMSLNSCSLTCIYSVLTLKRFLLYF